MSYNLKIMGQLLKLNFMIDKCDNYNNSSFITLLIDRDDKTTMILN